MFKKLVLLVCVCLIFLYIYMLIPREFNKSYEGVKYRLGDSEDRVLENITIEFQGKLTRTFTLKEKFKGTIKINDFETPSKNSNREFLVMEFGYQKLNPIVQYDDKLGMTQFFGVLYMSRDHNKLSITVFEEEGWSGENGLMISAPASNREQALIITNEVMEHRLNDVFKQFE